MKKNLVISSGLAVLFFFTTIYSAYMQQQWKTQLKKWEVAVEARDLQIRQLQKEAETCQSKLALANQPTRPEKPTKTASSKPIRKISKEEWKTWRTKYRNNKENMTDMQFKEWWDEMKQNTLPQKGQRIESDGYVYEVKEGLLGGLTVSVDLEPASETFSVSEFTLKLDPKKDKVKALQLQKGRRIRFQGTLDSVDYFIGALSIDLSEVTIF